METCRHYRYRLPRELADELRDADPLPCEICDALPHRQKMAAETQQNLHVVGSIPVFNTAQPSRPLATTRRFSPLDEAARHSGVQGFRLWFDRLQSALRPHRS